MASSSSYSHKPRNNKNKNKSPVNGSKTDLQFENTTFVQVDPSNFLDVVQKLTGAAPKVQKLHITTAPNVQNLPITMSSRPLNGKNDYVDVDPIKPSFKLEEPRQSSRNFEHQHNQNGFMHGDQSAFAPRKTVMNASPLSTLDTFMVQWSPRTPGSHFMQEKIPLADRNFYLYPSGSAISRKAEPELLPLFPTSSNS